MDTEEDLIDLVSRAGYHIEHIENPSEAVQLAAVRQNPFVVRYIKNPTEAVQKAVIDGKSGGMAYVFVDNKTDSTIRYAIERNPYLVTYIDNPCDEYKLLAVQNDGHVLGEIADRSYDLCLAAVKQNGFAIQHVERHMHTEHLQRCAIHQDPRAIDVIDQPYESVQLEMVQKHKWSYQYIDKPTRNVMVEAIRLGCLKACDDLVDPTPEEQELITMCKLQH